MYGPTRYIPNDLPDPPTISPVAILDPDTRDVIQERFQMGFGEITRRIDPFSRDMTIYTGPAGIGLVALHIALCQKTEEEKVDYLKVAENYIRGTKVCPIALCTRCYPPTHDPCIENTSGF